MELKSEQGRANPHAMDKYNRVFEVEDVGRVTRNNAVFTYCNDLDAVDTLGAGEEAWVSFSTGMGSNQVRVRRIE